MEYIVEYNNSLPKNICESIITKFEEQENKYPGVTMNGHDSKIKNTTDFHLMHQKNNEWKEIDDLLTDELNKKFNEYIKNLFKDLNKESQIYRFNNVKDRGFQIQKYYKNCGFYNYHHDGYCEPEFGTRILTFLWYLNDVEDGGETEFFGGKFKIKPEIGKLVLFPCYWTYPHKGCMPKSNDKYIITGWLYSK